MPRHLGGGHEAENLTLLCSGHHRALHDGLLTITGLAPNLVVKWKFAVRTDASLQSPVAITDRGAVADAVASPSVKPVAAGTPSCSAEPSPHVGPALGAAPSNYGWVVRKTEAVRALAQMGFTNQEARAVVEKAANDLPRDCSPERLMRAALRLTHR